MVSAYAHEVNSGGVCIHHKNGLISLGPFSILNFGPCVEAMVANAQSFWRGAAAAAALRDAQQARHAGRVLRSWRAHVIARLQRRLAGERGLVEHHRRILTAAVRARELSTASAAQYIRIW